jgi:ABC-type transport system involved in cytochrome bd biosynthesis fused ATPase/permease subunit
MQPACRTSLFPCFLPALTLPLRPCAPVLPQEPVLFSGTVRSNLDPFDSHSDPELWAALGVVALKDYVKGLGGWSGWLGPVQEDC